MNGMIQLIIRNERTIRIQMNAWEREKHNCQLVSDTGATPEGLDLTACSRTPASTPEHTMASWRTRGYGKEC